MAILRERRITSYPPMPIVEMIKGLAMVEETSESNAATQAMKGYFDSLPADKKMQILNAARGIKMVQKLPSKHSY